MSRYSKIYVNLITGKEVQLQPEFHKKLPTRTYRGKDYPHGGLVLKNQAKVDKPDAAQPREFGQVDAEMIRSRILSGDLKGFTSTAMKKFAEFEGIETDDELDLRGWIKLVSDHVKGGEPEKKEVKKKTTRKTTKK